MVNKQLSALSYILYEMVQPPIINTLLKIKKSHDDQSMQDMILQFRTWFEEKIVQRYVEFRSVPVHIPHPWLWFLSRYEWHPVPFKTEEHFRHIHMKQQGDETEFRHIVNAVISEPMNKQAPLWSVVLISNYHEDQLVAILRLHHTLGDGMSLMELFLSVSDEADEIQETWPEMLGSVPKHLVDEHHNKHKHSHLLVKLFYPLLLSVYIIFGFALCLLRYTVMALRSWDKTKLHVPYPASKDHKITYSFAYTPKLSVDRLKAIAKHKGSTVTTLVMYCLCVAMSQYLESHGESLEKRQKNVLFSLAVNSRLPKPTPKDKEWHVSLDNLSTGGFFPFPLLHNAIGRNTWDYMHKTVHRIKTDFDIYVSRFICEFVSLAIPLRWSVKWIEYFNMQTMAGATNVPGPSRAIHICGGNQIEEIFFIMPNPMQVFCAFSYCDTLRVSYITSPQTVPDNEAVINNFMSALHDLETRTFGENKIVKS